MWKCSTCDEQVDDYLDVCWNCQTGKDGSSPEAYFRPEVVPTELQAMRERMSRQTDEDLSRTADPTKFLLEMLEENVPSFRGSSACLGLKRESDRLIVCLSSSHQFVATMSDRDIAESLSIAIFDLKMGGQLFTFPDPIVAWE